MELMPYNQEVNPLASPDPEAKQFLSDQGDSEILQDNLEEVMHNISFNESHHRFVQSLRVTTMDVHTSPMYFE